VIKNNLNGLYQDAYKQAQKATTETIVEAIITETNESYINMGITSYLQDEEVIELRKYSKDKKLNDLFEKAKEINIPEVETINQLKTEIKSLFEKFALSQEKRDAKIQAILIEHDYHPHGYVSIYGVGDYLLLSNPEYLVGLTNEVIAGGIGKLDYSVIWNRLYEMEEAFGDLEYGELILDSEIFQIVEKVIKLKTAVILNTVFEELGNSLFEGLQIETPLNVYMGEHDGKQLSVYQLI
jgi:hypothetical protein